MNLIRVMKIERLGSGQFRVEIEVRTSVGQITFPVDVDDHGSVAQSERHAYLELQKLLEEALGIVRKQIA